MSVYRVTTMRRAIPVLTRHKCSKCGADNLKKQFLTAEASYNDRGAFRKATVEKRENAAKADLEDKTDEVIAKARMIDKNSNFYRFNLDGKCSQCGNVEPWGKMNNRILEIISTIGGVVAFFTLMFMLLGKISQAPLHMWIVFAVGLLVCSTKYIWILIQKIKTAQLPDESIPKVYHGENDVKRLVKELGNDYPLQDIDAKAP